MIKKAVLTLTLTPFLMVFSSYSYSYDGRYAAKGSFEDTCIASRSSIRPSAEFYSRHAFVWLGGVSDSGCEKSFSGQFRGSRWVYFIRDASDFDQVPANPIGFFTNHVLTDEQCSTLHSGPSVPLSSSSANYLTSGGSFTSSNGSCSVSGSSSVCSEFNGEVSCTVTLDAISTGNLSSPESDAIDLNDAVISDADLPFNDFESDYLNPLPGACSDSANCVSIGDTSYLVDWDSAPDWFSYVGSDGQTYSKPVDTGGDDTGGSSGDSSGGDSGGSDSGGSTGGGDSGGSSGGDSGGDTGGSDSGGSSGGSTGGGSSGGSTGGDTGGGDSGGSTGGGSTVPDFEFDESGIIEAIGSAGESNQAGLDAVSNDVTGAIGEQTEETKGMFDGLGNTITNALGLGTCYPDSQQTEEGHTAATSDKGLLGCIQSISNGMVNKLAEKFTEDLGDGNDLFNSSGVDQTLDGLAEEQQLYNDDVNTLMDEIGDGSSSDIANQITSRLPSLPSGSCSPLPFGPMEISCQAFNTIKLWLSWIVYFWTVVSVVDTFFRSGMRTA